MFENGKFNVHLLLSKINSIAFLSIELLLNQNLLNIYSIIVDERDKAYDVHEKMQ